jgi:hypothetical protein
MGVSHLPSSCENQSSHFRTSHGALAPQLQKWLPNVPRMALSASLTPEMLAGSVQSACDLMAPCLHLRSEPRRNLVAHVEVGGTAAQLKAALGLKGPAVLPGSTRAIRSWWSAAMCRSPISLARACSSSETPERFPSISTLPSSAEADAAFDAFLKAVRWGQSATRSNRPKRHAAKCASKGLRQATPSKVISCVNTPEHARGGRGEDFFRR